MQRGLLVIAVLTTAATGCRAKAGVNPYADLPPPPEAESNSQERADALDARAREASQRAEDLAREVERRQREAAQAEPEAPQQSPDENGLESPP
jgi:hypothetical protein